MSNPPRWFTLEIPDALARKMTRAEYYRVRSWLRRMARAVAKELSPTYP
jgi:hypothetical protein